MASCKYDWPEAKDRRLIGKRISRIDGHEKASGRARYTFDVNPPQMLFGKILRSPYAHAKIKSIDTSEAEKLPGVVSVIVMSPVGKEIQWAGDEIAAVAAEREEIAEDAIWKIKVEYDQLPFLVNEEDLSKAEGHTKPATTQKTGDPDKAFQDPDVVISEGYYGIPVITHCCLETHGHVVDWPAATSLRAYASTQGVSAIGGQFADPLEIKASDVEIICNYVGGPFRSNFAMHTWGIAAAKLSKAAGGRPVKVLLERDHELLVAGSRPSAFAKVRVAAKKDGTLVAWDSESWGTGGMGGGGVPPIPYVLKIPNQNRKHTAVATNEGSQRAWRAPNHPQACLITMGAIDDLAAKLKMDPVEMLIKNADLAPNPTLAKYYRE
ncbi:MAG: xanthine dehydrogenase family protein molybdopterin-binding subunit, partial [Acidobacteria bacterium]